MCWDQCKDLGFSNASPFKSSPENFNVNYNSQLGLELKWSFLEGAQLYVVQFRGFGESDWIEDNQLVRSF